VDKWDAMRDHISDSLKELIEHAKTAWEGASQKAAELLEAARTLKSHVTEKVVLILEAVSNKTSLLQDGGLEKLSELRSWAHEYYQGLGKCNGSVEMNNIKMNLVISNPTQSAAAIGQADTKLEYRRNNIQMSAICTLPVDTPQVLNPQGQTEFNCVGAFDTAQLTSSQENLEDFLADAATGALAVDVQADAMQFVGQSVVWHVQPSQLQTLQGPPSLVDESQRKLVQHLSMTLPDSFKEKARDAISGLDKLKDTPEESLEDNVEGKVEDAVTTGQHNLETAGAAETQVLWDEAAAAEREAEEEQAKADEAAREFESAVNEAIEQAKLITSHGRECKNDGGEGNCGQHGEEYDWCRTNEGPVGYKWDYCVLREDTAKGWTCKNSGGEGECAKHGLWSYTWCRTTNGEWDYCVPQLFDED